MKNILLLVISAVFISLNAAAQEKKVEKSPSIEKKTVMQKKSTTIMPAKQVNKSEVNKATLKAIREVSPKKREEDQ